jgi:GAF domain-containing protein
VGDDFSRVAAFIAQQATTPDQAAGVIGMLQRLCGAAVRALSASGVGMSVMAADGMRGITAASDPASERIEELQFLLGEGPCIDAFATRRPVLVPNLADGPMNRWPVYAPAVYGDGVRAVFAFPLQVGAALLGVLDVFRARPGSLSGEELRLALTFADVAVTTLLDSQQNVEPGATTDGLDEAILSRSEVYQAQGMVMVQLGVTLGEALARMRAYAFAEGRHLDQVARDVVARSLRFDEDKHGEMDGGGHDHRIG